MHPAITNVLRFFKYSHLPPALQEVSRPFAELAQVTANRAPDSQETTVALRKLLEAKDAAVRAVLRFDEEKDREHLKHNPESDVAKAARKGFESK